MACGDGEPDSKLWVLTGGRKMKGKLDVLFLGIALLFFFASCIKDDRNNYLPSESVYLLEGSLQSVSLSSGQYRVVIVKSGKGLTSCRVSVSSDERVLQEYNASEGESLLYLPDNVFSLSESVVNFSKSDFCRVVTVSWEPAALSALLSLGEYAIPLSISCEGAQVMEGKSAVIIKPVK